MADNENEKRARALGAGLLEKLTSAAQKSKETKKEINDARPEWVEGLKAGFHSEFTDFEEAMERGKTVPDPEDYKRATDDTDEPPKKTQLFERDLEKNLAKAREKAQKAKENMGGDYKDFESFREAKISQKIKTIHETMDKRGTDTITAKILGYDVRILRVPNEKADPKDITVSCNGRPVSVRWPLGEGEVSFSGDRPEISHDLIKKAASEMADTGRTQWSTDTKAGDHVEVSMKAMCGRVPVMVSDKLKGDETLHIEGGYRVNLETVKEAASEMADTGRTQWSTDTKAGDHVEVSMKAMCGRVPVMVSDKLKGDETLHIKAGPRVSSDIFDRAYNEMKRNGTYNYTDTMPNGRVVDCGIHVKINGQNADIEGWGSGSGNNTVDKKLFEHALLQMKEKGTQRWSITMDDGTTININLFVQVDGDKRAAIDYGRTGNTVEDEQERILVSKDAMAEATENLIAGSGATRKYTIDTKDGTPIEFTLNTKVNGRDAVPEEHSSGDTAWKEAERILVSKDTMAEATENLIAGSGSPRKWGKDIAEGKSIEYTMGAKVNGYDAIPERAFGDDMLREERGKIMIGKGVLEKAVRQMDAEGSTTGKLVMPDGRELKFKRPAKSFEFGDKGTKESVDLKMFVNGSEIRAKDFREALAEVSGVNSNKWFDMGAETGSMTKKQTAIQVPRTVVSSGISLLPRSIAAANRNTEMNSALAGRLLGMLFQQLSRTTGVR